MRAEPRPSPWGAHAQSPHRGEIRGRDPHDPAGRVEDRVARRAGVRHATTPAAEATLAYLAAHAEIYRQEYHDNRVLLRCYLPKHLVYHIQEPDVQIRVLGNGEAIQ